MRDRAIIVQWFCLIARKFVKTADRVRKKLTVSSRAYVWGNGVEIIVNFLLDASIMSVGSAMIRHQSTSACKWY